MRRLIPCSLLLALLLLLAGCTSARLIETIHTAYTGPPARCVAIDPRGGILADEIAMELYNSGLNVLDADQTSLLASRTGVSEFHINSPEGHEALRTDGVDALLVVKSLMSWDGTPQTVTVRLISTHTSQIITGLSWQNGWGGDIGSVLDRSMRKDIPEAAGQIAEALLTRIR